MSQATPSKNEPIDVETAIKFVESLLRKRKRDSLTPMEETIFICAWEDKEFNEIVTKFGWNDGTVRNTASKLWERLTEVLEVKVTKKKLKGAVGSVWRSHQAQPQLPQPLNPPPPPNWQNPQLVDTLTEHQDGVGSVAISPDGQTLASGSWDGTIELWDLQNGKPKRTLTGHSKDVASVIFCPDGQTLVSSGYDNTIKRWHLDTGNLLRNLYKSSSPTECFTVNGHSHRIECFALSPEGQVIASSSHDKTVRLWNIRTGEEVKIRYRATEVISVAFSPDGETLASGSMDGAIELWDLRTGKIRNIPDSKLGWVVSLAFSPDGQTLFSGSKNGTIERWHLDSGKPLKPLEGHLGAVFSLAFSPDGQTLASGSWDNTIKLWNFHTGKLLRTLDEHSKVVMSVTFSPDGQRLVSGSGDSTIKIWRAT